MRWENGGKYFLEDPILIFLPIHGVYWLLAPMKPCSHKTYRNPFCFPSQHSTTFYSIIKWVSCSPCKALAILLFYLPLFLPHEDVLLIILSSIFFFIVSFKIYLSFLLLFSGDYQKGPASSGWKLIFFISPRFKVRYMARCINNLALFLFFYHRGCLPPYSFDIFSALSPSGCSLPCLHEWLNRSRQSEWGWRVVTISVQFSNSNTILSYFQYPLLLALYSNSIIFKLLPKYFFATSSSFYFSQTKVTFLCLSGVRGIPNPNSQDQTTLIITTWPSSLGNSYVSSVGRFHAFW